jgi:parallel beta-helix repeat protein
MDYKPLVNPTYLTGPPIITTTNIQTAFVGKYYSVNYTAYDPDTPQNQLFWTMLTNASWLNFSTTQELHGTPTSADVGVFWVDINVSDGFYTDSTYFLITVTEFGIPSITTTNVLTAYVGEVYSVYYNAYDANTPQNQLLWTMNTNATWLNFSPNQRLFGTPYSSHIGSYWVNISVSDGNFSDSTNFTLTVRVRSQPPGPGTGSVIIVRTGQQFIRIQNAINNATAGDTIRIYAGMYNENIIINKRLSLIGNGSTNTIINGSGLGSTIRITANSCNISDLDAIDSSIWSGWRDAGILILSDYNYIESCMFYGNDHGIFLSNSDYNIISNCNFIDNNYDDINLSNSNYNIISNCHCYSNGGMRISNSDYNKIENCSSRNSNLDGIFLCFSNLNIIKNNNLSSNYYGGISLRGSSNYNTITYNNFINNQYGVVTIEGSSYNSIYLNNFVNNSSPAQARDTGNGNIWNGSLKGNHWSDWTSPDNNSDGIVDFPYNITGSAGAKDYLPLINIVGQIPPPSSAPIITTQNVLSAYVGILYSVNYTATDQDTPINLLTWRMRTNASWLNFSSSQRLYGTPSSLDIGSFWVYIEVSDSINLDSTNFTLTVRSSPPPPGGPSPQINHSSIGNNSYNVSVNNSQLTITFSTPMNRSSVESALSILPTLNYTIIWNNNSTQMTIIFTENLSYNTTYTITISTSARDTFGNRLNSPYTLIFTTEKEIQIDEPEDKPDEGMDFVDDIAFLGIIIGLILIIIIIVVFTLFIFGKRKIKAEPEKELEEPESRVELAGGDIADDYDVDEYSEEESDEFIKNLIDEVRINKKSSDFGLSEDEMLDKIRIKYRKGEISKETYDSIKDLLIIKEY